MQRNGRLCEGHLPDVLVSEEAIRGHVATLAAAVERDHAAHEPLVIVGIMKGALVFVADLIRQLPMPLEVELVNARSYRGTRQGREVELLDGVAGTKVAGRPVLIVDCVLDSGRTLAALHREVSRHSPSSLRTCVLLSKERERASDVHADYVGCTIPDVFVVGYGLDHDNRWRHLPYVAELPPEAPDGGPAL